MERIVEIVMFAPLAIAGWSDVLTRRVPDWTAGLLAVLGIVVRVAEGPRSLGMSVAAAVVLFAILLIVYARNAIGGGDVKLATAIALGLTPLATLHFVIATAMAGGLIGVFYLILRRNGGRLPAPSGAGLPARLWAIERWRARRRGIPYAVAIAAGAAYVLVPSLRY